MSIYEPSSNESQLKTEKINSVRNDSCEILEKCKHRVTVLKISSNMHHRNFEDAILLSLSNARRKAEKSNQQHKLANELILAIAWNRFDYAREYLLNDETRPKYTEGDLHRALLNALCHSYIDCIELLLDFGASFKNLTHDDLKRLYDQPSHNPLPIADEEEPLKKSRYYADYLKRIGFKTIHSEEKENGLPSQSAVQDLFLWAIFSNRFELATTPLNLLLGAYIYRHATRLKLNTDMQEQYHKHANQLEEIAVSIIDMSYEYDKFFTLSLLEHEVDTFNHMTLLKFAETVQCKSFLASRCVQRYLQKIWYGNIDYTRKYIDLRVTIEKLILRTKEFFFFSDNRFPIMLVNYFPLNIYGESRSGHAGLPMPTFEITLHVCIWGLICEEIRQV
ncbi:unnamed protein product [Rotaria sordida]|uniref:TRPM-like domain-containing protein n=2 Tax=Rotaria sordida TaxID=392033 RepID=A0A815HLR6_9BILA|nr:unnamed protein product [Rotaria sordida]